MTLGQSIIQSVRERAPFHDRIEQIFANEQGMRVHCEISEAEKLGCAVVHLEFARDRPETVATEELAQRVESLCGRLTYLLEPLRPVEVDRRSHTVLARSSEPRKRDNGLSYYELIADGGLHLSLRRYRFDFNEKKRAPVPFVVSEEQFEMLLDDLLFATARTEHN